MSNRKPILLSKEQHERVKNNLSEMLKSTFSITNQSNGKLDYLAAVLMGFDNHHQRKALLGSVENSEHAITVEMPSMWPDECMSPIDQKTAIDSITPLWPEGWLRTRDGNMSQEDKDALMSRGWFEFGSDGDYDDFEIEFAYDVDRLSVEVDYSSKHTFNLRMTFSHEDKSVYLMIGDNLGDGFNEHLGFTISDSCTLPSQKEIIKKIVKLAYNKNKQSQIRRFGRNFIRNKDIANYFLQELRTIRNWLIPNGETDAA